MYPLIICFGIFAISNGYVNVALNKPAYQQYPWYPDDDRYGASTAVDGHKSDLSLGGGQCAVSQNGPTATWLVNLTSVHSIHQITIYFMAGNKPLGPCNFRTNYYLGFSVFVSNTTDRLQGTLCYKDDNFTLDTIPAVFTTTCPVHGQYVIYYKERVPGVTYPDGYSENVGSYLCEDEVYGCPATGCYWSKNTRPCPDVNCQYCHRETGTCKGCKLGYRGHRCEQVCPVGYFGHDCSETCINSYTCDGCDKVTGSCGYGCRPGWIGYFCQKSQLFFEI